MSHVLVGASELNDYRCCALNEKTRKRQASEAEWREIQHVFQQSRETVGDERERRVRKLTSNDRVHDAVMRLLEAYDSSDIDLEKITADAALEFLVRHGHETRH